MRGIMIGHKLLIVITCTVISIFAGQSTFFEREFYRTTGKPVTEKVTFTTNTPGNSYNILIK
jgi:hypothetical protein